MSYEPYKPDNIDSMFFHIFNIKPYVYDKTKFTLYECVLSAMGRVNEIIKEINDVGDALVIFEAYVIDELSKYDDKIKAEVNITLNELLTNGKLENLINQTLFGQINSDITNIKNSVDLINSELLNINYKKPSVTVGISPSQNLYNVGESINSVILNFNIIKGSNNLVKAEIYKNDVLVSTITNIVEGNNTYIDGNIINSNTIYKIKIYDNKDFIESNKIIINFVTEYYYGVTNESNVLNSTFIKSLSRLKSLKQNLTEQFSCLNQKIVFAYPQLYGDLISILFYSVDYLESFDKSNILVDGIDYNIYISNNYLTDTFILTFNIMLDNIITTELITTSIIDGGTF